MRSSRALTTEGFEDWATPQPMPLRLSVSPDGKKAIFICDWNLWIKDVATGAERQLTSDGVKDFGYATSNAGWTTSAAASLSWSPDSKKIATQQQDERQVGDMYLVETPVNGGHPVLKAWKYPLPGDPVVAMMERVVIDVDSGKITRLKMPRDFHRAMSEDNIDMTEYLWSPDGAQLGFVSTDRFHKNSTAKVADTNTGDVRTLFTETEATHVQTRVQWQILWDTNEVLWYSQRDNTAQMYLYDLKTGQLKNPITSGVGPITRIARLDKDTRTMWYEAVGKEPGQDPYFTHLYRIGLDGKNNVSLTPDNGTHTAQISPDGKDLVRVTEDINNVSSWNSARLTLNKNGRRVIIDYIRMDLSDGVIVKHPSHKAFIEQASANRTLVKAASHLLQMSYFQILRNLILKNAPSVIQDETGIEYAALAREFKTRLYGQFVKPHNLFQTSMQTSLAKAYQEAHDARPLAFRLGYDKTAGSSVVVAGRGGVVTPPPRNCGAQ